MDRVARTQAVALGHLSGEQSNGLTELDHVKLREATVEPRQRGRKLRSRQSSGTLSGRERCTQLGIEQPGADHAVGRVPDRIRERRIWFTKQQLDERRRLDVDDQRRCSMTMSETLPRTGM